jgi:hypothetical protein
VLSYLHYVKYLSTFSVGIRNGHFIKSRILGQNKPFVYVESITLYDWVVGYSYELNY